MMNNKNDISLREAIEHFKKAFGIERKLDEAALMNSWDEVAGKAIVKHTQNLNIKNRVLYVQLDSSVIRNELMMAREKIKNALNDAVGKQIIDDVVFR